MPTSQKLHFSDENDLARWIDPLYGPGGIQYFESTTLNNSHRIDVSTRLVFNYDADAAPVPEPATILMFSAGLIGFGGFRRKFRK